MKRFLLGECPYNEERPTVIIDCKNKRYELFFDGFQAKALYTYLNSLPESREEEIENITKLWNTEDDLREMQRFEQDDFLDSILSKLQSNN